jgi:hypothetical protein
MKILCFQARRFRWKTHSKTITAVPDRNVEEEIAEAVVVFLHAEVADGGEARRVPILRKTLKHIKWLANKRELKNIVIHSFAHLGGDTAESGMAEQLIEEISQRLQETGYNVWVTPFGYFCEWDLSVYGDSLAKVWQAIE